MKELEVGTEVVLPEFGDNDGVILVPDMYKYIGAVTTVTRSVLGRNNQLLGYKVQGNDWTWVLTDGDVVASDTPNINPHMTDDRVPILVTGFTGTKYPFEELTQHLLDKSVPAMDKQVGGDHYKALGIQPMELVLANMGYDAFKGACYVKINKYMIRNKDNEVEQLKKARHILSMWIEEAEKR